jgi:hypothetical protein
LNSNPPIFLNREALQSALLHLSQSIVELARAIEVPVTTSAMLNGKGNTAVDSTESTVDLMDKKPVINQIYRRTRSKSKPNTASIAAVDPVSSVGPEAAVSPVPELHVVAPPVDIDKALQLALSDPGTPFPSSLNSIDAMWPLDTADESDMAQRDEIKRLITATLALHPGEGVEAVKSALAAVAALRLADVPEWLLPKARSAICFANIDLRAQIARGELA